MGIEEGGEPATPAGRRRRSPWAWPQRPNGATHYVEWLASKGFEVQIDRDGLSVYHPETTESGYWPNGASTYPPAASAFVSLGGKYWGYKRPKIPAAPKAAERPGERLREPAPTPSPSSPHPVPGDLTP